MIIKNTQYYKFCFYGFLKNLRFFDAFFILFLVHRGLSYSEIGILYAVREVSIHIFELPSGLYADSYGRKKALIFSFILYIISFVLFNIALHFWLFLPAFVLYGVADAFRSGTHKAMIMDYLKENNWEHQKITYYGSTRSCSQKGSAISALLAGLIVFFYGNYQGVFLFSIIPYVLNMLLVWSYPNYLNLSVNTRKNKGLKTIYKETFNTFLSVFKQARVMKVVHSSAIHSAFQKAIKDYIQPLMLRVIILIPFFNSIETQKRNGLFVGVFYFMIYLLTAYFSKKAGVFQAKSKRDASYMSLIYGFGFGILSGVFFNFDWKIVSLISFVGIYLVENLRKPILTGLLADNVPNEVLASVLSAQSLWKTLMTALLSLTLGFLADVWGIGTAFILVSTLLILLSFFINRK